MTESDTAQSVGTGDVAVLATSTIVAWCEAASFNALAPFVPAGSTSVAMRLHMDHIHAASVGCLVTSIATLERVEGRRYVFVVSALADNNEQLASGRVVRVIVEVDSFLSNACGSAN